MQNKVIIIAEAGVNHNGDFNLAKELVKVAADAKADFIKFQTFAADKIVSQSAKKAVYQLTNIHDEDDSQYAMLKKLEIPKEWYNQLIDYANKLGISFLSTAFDEASIDFLNTLDVQLFKIPSGEITNKPYLEHIAKKGKNVILSTGMSDIFEIKAAVNVLIDAGLEKEKITVLHCNTEYPTPMKDVNIIAMLHIKDELGVEVGYSDHTLGIEIPIAAVALGAKVIEKHFTINRNLPGPDHKASLEPDELIAMINAIRNVEKAISGTGTKVPSESELPNRIVARKSVHIKRAILKGTLIKMDDLIMLRPGDGISPMNIDMVIGKKVNTNLAAGYKLRWENFEK